MHIRSSNNIVKYAPSQLAIILYCMGGFSLPPTMATSPRPIEIPLQIDTLGSITGTSQWDWWQARTAYIPGEEPLSITTMSETGKDATHDFHDIYQSTSRDGGKTWSAAQVIPTLRRQKQEDGYEVAPGDLWPGWHTATQTVLATGKTFNFREGKREDYLRERVSYAVMQRGRAWGPLQFLQLPERDLAGSQMIAANAGCTQRHDLPNGDILLPIRYVRKPEVRNYTSTVVRCSFDGKRLNYQQHGTELNIAKGRGLYEPSLTEFGGQYFLTLRADHSAFVTRSKDGLHFDPIREWKFDDGNLLGSYNTQQHWVKVGGGLFLVYTRRGADNDHIMRHRAPLFIGQVNPETLQVMRDTERVLIKENSATLGNSGICRISDTESWVTCGEGLLRLGKRKGKHNNVLFVKITTK